MNDQPGVHRADSETWSRRLTDLLEAGKKLLSTRTAILGEELGVKAGILGRGLGGLFLAAAFGGLALLLFTAWIAALFTKLLGGPVAGILAAFVLYLAVAAAAAVYGVKSLSRVKPFEFPATSGELRKDWEALRASAAPEPTPGEPSEPPPGSPPTEDDLEARYRAGSE
jgi:hypothetical protein